MFLYFTRRFAKIWYDLFRFLNNSEKISFIFKNRETIYKTSFFYWFFERLASSFSNVLFRFLNSDYRFSADLSPLTLKFIWIVFCYSCMRKFYYVGENVNLRIDNIRENRYPRFGIWLRHYKNFSENLRKLRLATENLTVWEVSKNRKTCFGMMRNQTRLYYFRKTFFLN